MRFPSRENPEVIERKEYLPFSRIGILPTRVGVPNG
jgi:hypothetical protein